MQRINKTFFTAYIYQSSRPKNKMVQEYATMREQIRDLWVRYLNEGIVP